MTLIHTALQSEAQAFIEVLKLKLTSKNPKIYQNDTILLLISGIGKDNTINALEYVYKEFNIKKSFNIGIAACSNKDEKIGTLFCTNHHLLDIIYSKILTVDKVKVSKEYTKETILYDMEAEHFLQTSTKYLEEENIYIFKVISDYLEDTILEKDFVKSIIRNHMISLKKYLIN